MAVALATALMSTNPANAQSAYDDALVTVDELKVCDPTTEACTGISANWYSTSIDECHPNYTDGLVTAVEGDGTWAVFSSASPAMGADKNTPDRVTVLYKESGTLDLFWSTDWVRVSSQQYSGGYYLTWDGTDFSCQGFTNSAHQSISFPEDLGSSCNGLGFVSSCALFLSTFNPNYPQDYDGLEVPDSYTEVTTVLPYFTIQVLPNGTTSITLDGSWFDDFPTENFYAVIGLEDSSENLIEPDENVGWGNVYETLPQGEYTAYFAVEYIPALENYEFDTAIVNFIVDGRGLFYYYTGENACMTVSGVVVSCDLDPPDDPEAEPLSADFDVECDLSDFGCHLGNMINWIGDLMLGLFVPSPGYMQSLFNDLRVFFEDRFGFFAQPFIFIFDLFDAVLTPNSQDFCSWGMGDWFDSPFELNFCALEEQFPSVFNTVTVFIRAFAVMALIFALHAKYIRTVSGGTA
jgi:hypothetical protein